VDVTRTPASTSSASACEPFREFMEAEPMVRDAQTGKFLTLGYSRKAVRLLMFRSSSRIWAQLHEKAFRGC
jgi:hypothetical protein